MRNVHIYVKSARTWRTSRRERTPAEPQRMAGATTARIYEVYLTKIDAIFFSVTYFSKHFIASVPNGGDNKTGIRRWLIYSVFAFGNACVAPPATVCSGV